MGATGIHFISGKPGGGKSMLATKAVLDVLAETRKRVVTNLPLNVGNIRAYLIEKHGKDFDVLGRVRILSPEETATFWVYFGQGQELDKGARITMALSSGKKVSHQSFASRFEAMKRATASEETQPGAFVGRIEEELERWHEPAWDGGICYVIDEAHEFFNARGWADTGIDALHYLSQHRKVGDEVYFVTQHVKNVDTQLRRVSQDFTYVKNLRKTKAPFFFGVFKAPPIFVTTSYLDERSGTAQEAVETRTFTLDTKGIGSCYDTAAGVGVAGSQADIGSKTKGLPWWLLPTIIGVLVVGGFGTALWFKGYISRKASKSVAAATHPTNSTTRPIAPVPAARTMTPPALPTGQLETNKPVKLVGWAYDPAGRVMMAFLTDGRTLRSAWHFTGPDTITSGGKEYTR